MCDCWGIPALIKPCNWNFKRGRCLLHLLMKRKNKLYLCLCYQYTKNFMQSLQSEQEMGSFSSAALRQEVIKHQMPGTAHSPAITAYNNMSEYFTLS